MEQIVKIVLFLSFLGFCFSNCAVQSLQRTYINPHNGYSEAVIVKSNQTQTIYISGQIGAGTNLEEQMRSALDNMSKLLAECGATFEDVVKMNSYIVNYTPSDLDIFRKVRKEVMGEKKMPASTLVGVQSLALEGWLIELEAVAVIGN